jgi:hypothetical protein
MRSTKELGRIRYAFSAEPPRAAAHEYLGPHGYGGPHECAGPQEYPGPHEYGGPQEYPGPHDCAGPHDYGSWGGTVGGWPTPYRAAGRRTDAWVLVCGGLAAVAAFAAAFLASGGAVSHAATPGATVPAVVSQACPSPAAP